MQRDTILRIGIVASILSLLFIAGCTPAVSQPATTESCKIDDYGHGVLIFECTNYKFAQALSGYLDSHTVIVSSVATIPSLSCEGNNCGYIVVVR